MKMDFLQGLEDVQVKDNADLTTYSTMRLKSYGTLVIVSSVSALAKVLKLSYAKGVSFRVIGKGSNQLFPETSPTPYLSLDFPYDKEQLLDQVRPTYQLPASIPLKTLTAHAIRFGLKGWEVFSGIPGQLGGSVFMNAGTGLGEIGRLVKKVSLLTAKGERREVIIDHDRFNDFFLYRKNLFCHPGDVITHVEMMHQGVDEGIAELIRSYLRKRSADQPLNAATCGCTFKNYSDCARAGLIIDRLGFKGFQYGNFRISPKHANFIENLGEGTYSEFLQLVRFIQQTVKSHYDFEFELEAKI